MPTRLTLLVAALLLTGCTILNPPRSTAMIAPVAATKIDPPRPLRSVAPAYPATMRLYGVPGQVRLHCLVGRNGDVSRVRVIDSSESEFEQPAICAVRNWTFTPGTIDGRPAGMWVMIPIHFEVRDVR